MKTTIRVILFFFITTLLLYFAYASQPFEKNSPLAITQTKFEKTIEKFKKTLVTHKPHIQKLSLDPKTKYQIIVIGDLHGSAHSLERNLTQLQKDGYLATDLTLSKNTYLVFTGDYADRGKYGVDVWYLAMKLKILNPSSVFLLRGNHETKKIAHYYGLEAELLKKYDSHTRDILFNLFDHLPLALYVGVGIDFLQFCHGAIPVTKNKNDFIPFIPLSLLETKNKNDYLELTDTNIIDQYLWNDFAGARTNGIARSNRGIGHKITIENLETFLAKNKKYSHSDITIHNVLHGHQHIDAAVSTLSRKTTFKNGTTIPLSRSPVYTFISCPEGMPYYVKHEGYGIIEIDGPYKNWTLTVYEQKN